MSKLHLGLELEFGSVSLVSYRSAAKLKHYLGKPPAESTNTRNVRRSYELRDITYRYTPVKSTKDSAKFGIPKGSGSVSGRGRKSIGAMHAVRSGSRPRRDAVPSWTKAERNQIIEMTSDYVMGRR